MCGNEFRETRYGDTSAGFWSADGATPEQACWRLAKLLYEAMEYVEPEIGKAWDDLAERHRSYCYDLITEVLNRKELLKKALGD